MGMSGSGGRAVPFINVTPLIDVLLVVIIIFLVITPLLESLLQLGGQGAGIVHRTYHVLVEFQLEIRGNRNHQR